MRRAAPALDFVLIFLLAAVLVAPLFHAKYLNHWDSIESTFIADGRFLKDHLPHPQWQPLWYCGTRYDYLYPPVLRYGTALLSFAFVPVKAYHIYTALLYCLGIAGVYFLVRIANGSRGAAWLAALASALVSPVSLVIPWKGPFGTPWHLWILLGPGEGPHVCSVALLPFALAFSWLALTRSSRAHLAAAAVCSALVAMTNFYGAAALAALYPLLVWAIWISRRDRSTLTYGAAIPVLAYGLSAFWLTPSYIRITLENLRYVSSRGNAASAVIFAAALAVFAVVSYRAAAGKPRRAYAVFLCGSLLILGLNVVGHFYFNFRVIGEPHRLASELDLAMILASTELLRRLWSVRRARAIAVAIVLLALWSGRHYVRHAWDLYPREADFRHRVEYRMPEWIATHMPQARTFVSGSVRFWWDTWHDLEQVGGGSDQGILNSKVMPANWEILMGPKPEMAVLWLTALGADAVIVSNQNSQEIYHDFKVPDKFVGVLPVLYDDGAGNAIYKVPRRYSSLARVVDRAALDAIEPLEQTNLDRLRAYHTVVEQGPEAPTSTAWAGTGELLVRARPAAGQSILVQATFDPAWHAYAGGHEVPVRRDRGADFMVIDAPAGSDEVRLVFETPLENRIGQAVTMLSLIAIIGLFLRPGLISPREKG